jgi:hypothetical protein
MSDENALVQIADANVSTLDETMDNLWESLQKTAAANIQGEASGEGVDLQAFTAVELRALLFTEMLNLSKGLGFAELVVQGRILDTMERESLHSVHPGGYTTLDELAQDQGISISELSQIKDLTQTIFPWVKDKLNMEPEYLWSEVGKSKLRELVPLLKRTITAEVARGTVENSYNAVANDVAATYLTANPGEDAPDGEELQVLVAEQLIEHGVNLTNANLRQTIRPDRTPSLEPVIVRRFTNGMAESQIYVLMQISDDQMTMLERRLHGHWDPVRTTASNRGDVESIRMVRQLLEG